MDISNDDKEENMVGNEIVGCVDEVDLRTDNKSDTNNYMPQNGMEFETKEEAYAFYREYARFVGFGITIKSSRRSKKSGNFIDIKIACSRFGAKRQSTCLRTDCKASMHIKKSNLEGKWFVYSFMENHNHETCRGDSYSATRGNKNNQDTNQKKGLQLALNERDTNLLLDYFMHMQAEAPGFYYVIDFDEETRMQNVFWVSFKGRRDYVSFSDVVFFDTHYIKNKYSIPFIPIIGVNHHLQFILLGCALIGNETQSTYAWLMLTWLRAVNGHSPKVIITDNDKSLLEATAEVFPDASHYFCPWHVFGEVGPNLSQKWTGEFEALLMKLKKCVYRSWSNEEFEKRWKKMVRKFGLTENKWIGSLYDNRRKWVPTYTRNVFLGGFCTVERSQSIASSFDKYLKKDTTFEEFVNPYKGFLRELSEEEKVEIETQHVPPTLISHSPFEMQMSQLYTCAIYKNFQTEVLGIIACTVGKEGEDDKTIAYRVYDIESKNSFSVSWNKRNYDVCCSCLLFESSGFLCRHALSVLQLSGISHVPSKYILKRWTRKEKIRNTTCQASVNTKFRIERLNDLCKLVVEMGEKGSLSREAYQVACRGLEEALKHCKGMKSNQGLTIGPKEANSTVRGKEKPKKKKKRTEAEKSSTGNGIQDSSQDAEQLNQRSLGLHESYISQQCWQGMELGARISIMNGYYSTEQGVQGLGQLNSISCLHDCYYSDQPIVLGDVGNLNSVSARVSNQTTQQNLRGLGGQFNFRASCLKCCFKVRDSSDNALCISTIDYSYNLGDILF